MHQRLREANSRIDRQEQFGVLRRLKFFHEFSHAEIWEVLRASNWQDYAAGEEIVKEGEMDDRFYILVSGGCAVERHGSASARSTPATASARRATCRAPSAPRPSAPPAPVTVLKVSSTLLEQVSASCQLRFNRVFLRSLIGAPAERRARPGGGRPRRRQLKTRPGVSAPWRRGKEADVQKIAARRFFQ